MKIELDAIPYERTKKGDIKRLRKEGKIPAIMYGHKDKSRRILILEREFKEVLNVLRKEAVTINLKIDAKSYPCLIKVIQHNPINNELLHIDFQHIVKKEKIKATIPIHVIGEAPGVKKGGLLDQHLHEVIVRCLPDDMPSHFDVDISILEIGKTIHLKDIKPANVDFELSLDTTVVSVHVPKVEKAPVAPVVEAAAPAEEGKEEAPKDEKAAKEEKPKEEKPKPEEKPSKEPVKGK